MVNKKIKFQFATPLLLGITIAFLICSCKPKQSTESDTPGDPEENSAESIELPADFAEFYQKFHEDSIYQISHIIFPLEAYLTDISGQDSIATWTVQNWKIHKQFVADSFWDHRFEIPVEGMIQEFIFSKDGSFYLQRRFARSKNEWFLIYYSGMRANSEDWN